MKDSHVNDEKSNRAVEKKTTGTDDLTLMSLSFRHDGSNGRDGLKGESCSSVAKTTLV
jgi:hypothetical protein